MITMSLPDAAPLRTVPDPPAPDEPEPPVPDHVSQDGALP